MSRETQTVRCACRLVLARVPRARRPAPWWGERPRRPWWGPYGGGGGGGTARQGARPERTNDGAGGGPTVRTADSRPLYAPPTDGSRAARFSRDADVCSASFFSFSYTTAGSRTVFVRFFVTSFRLDHLRLPHAAVFDTEAKLRSLLPATARRFAQFVSFSP